MIKIKPHWNKCVIQKARLRGLQTCVDGSCEVRSPQDEMTQVSSNSSVRGPDHFEGLPLSLNAGWMQVLPYPTGVHLVETGRADAALILLKWSGQPWEVLWLDILPSDLFYPYSKSEPLTTCSPSMGFWPFCLDLQLPYLSAKLSGSIFW